MPDPLLMHYLVARLPVPAPYEDLDGASKLRAHVIVIDADNEPENKEVIEQEL